MDSPKVNEPQSSSLESYEQLLVDCMPATMNVQLPPHLPNDKEDIINSENARALYIINQAKLAAVNVYVKSEEERMKRQMPLLKALFNFTVIQTIICNVILFIVIIGTFMNSPSDLSPMFEMLKVYIGGTVIELIGGIVFIAKGTFSDNHQKIMEILLGMKPNNANGEESEDSGSNSEKKKRK